LSTHSREVKKESRFFKDIFVYLVFVEKKAEEIKEATVKLTNSQPSTTDYIAHHCRTVAELFRQLKDDEITMLKAITEQWNTQGTPAKVQER
jgi:hypothetical protein